MYDVLCLDYKFCSGTRSVGMSTKMSLTHPSTMSSLLNVIGDIFSYIKFNLISPSKVFLSNIIMFWLNELDLRYWKYLPVL